MPSTWPTSNDSFTTKVPRTPVASADINKIQDAIVALETDALAKSQGGRLLGRVQLATVPGADANPVMGVAGSNNASLVVPSSYPSDDIAGGTDGTGRITLYSYQRANYNAFGEVLRIFLMRQNAKAMMAYYGPQLPSSQTNGFNPDGSMASNATMKQWVWLGAHFGANDGLSVHGHWSIEVPDSAGALRTRFEIPFANADGTIGMEKTVIKTNQADFNVRTSNGQELRLSSSAGVEKPITFSLDSDGDPASRRWKIRVTSDAETGSNAGSNFQIVRYDDAGSLTSSIYIERSTGRIGLLGVTAPTAGLHLQRSTGQIVFLDALAASQSALLVQGVDDTVKALQAQVSGDTQKRFQVWTDGRLDWGSGSASADVNLYRGAADVLQTDDGFRALRLGVGTAVGTARLTAVENTDSNTLNLQNTTVGGSPNGAIIRAEMVTTGSALLSSRITGDTVARLLATADGRLNWGDGTNARDTNLYRSAADTLRTDDLFVAQGGLSVDATVRAAFLKTTSSTAHAATIYQAGTSGVDTAAAANIVSDNPESSAVYISGTETSRGTLKITHRNGSGSAAGDANAAAISIDVQQNGQGGTASRMIFGTSTDGGTSGSLVTLRNGGSDVFNVHNSGAIYSPVGGLGTPQPSNHGLLAWAYDPQTATNTTVLTAGVQYLVGLYIPYTQAVTKIYWHVGVAGATPTAGQNHVALYDSAGNRVGTANVDADISSTGLKTTTISSTTLQAGQMYWVSFIFNATTVPALVRTTGLAGFGALINAGLSASQYRFATNGTAKTTSPASITPASNAQGNPLWAAVGA